MYCIICCNWLQFAIELLATQDTSTIIWNIVNLLGNIGGTMRLVSVPCTLSTRDLLLPKQFITWNNKTSIRNGSEEGRQSTFQSVSQCGTLCTFKPCNDALCSWASLHLLALALGAISLNATSEVFSVFVLETKHKFYLNLAWACNIHVLRHASHPNHTHTRIWKWINIRIDQRNKLSSSILQ